VQGALILAPNACYAFGLAVSVPPGEAKPMKADIHPKYNEVVFQDVTTDFAFLTRSTKGSKETIKWTDGKDYPLIKVDVSSKSHPFYTGKQKAVDTGGRVDKFRKRYGQK
jgi:large subunit ribosomal protein L31